MNNPADVINAVAGIRFDELELSMLGYIVSLLKANVQVVSATLPMRTTRATPAHPPLQRRRS